MARLREWARRSMTGDLRNWFLELYDEHGGALEGFLFRRTGNHADACELAQETYLRMLQLGHIGSVHDRKAYMFTIAANLANQLFASRGRQRGNIDVDDPALDQELSHVPDFGTEIDQAEDLKRVRKYVDELPPNVSAAHFLQSGHGLSYEEIALHLSVTKHTVKKYLQQVHLHVQRRLAEEKE